MCFLLYILLVLAEASRGNWNGFDRRRDTIYDVKILV